MDKYLKFDGIISVSEYSIVLHTSRGDVDLDDAIRDMMACGDRGCCFDDFAVKMALSVELTNAKLVINGEESKA